MALPNCAKSFSNLIPFGVINLLPFHLPANKYLLTEQLAELLHQGSISINILV
ncbi:hypothetical protein [Acinetobacter phage Ab69]|nr:hypothetical protein [Acinetobacter phage Ab69]